jgi:hypothetical protein
MRPKRTAAAPDLSNDVLAVLLAGWGAEPPPSERRTHGFGGGYAELAFTGGPGPGGLWAQHEAYLRAVAARWGWRPTCRGRDGQLRYYGEAIHHERVLGVIGFRDALTWHRDELEAADDAEAGV